MTINGALNGGSLKAVSRYGDIQNKISIGSAGVFLAKDRFKEGKPYSKVYDTEGNLSLHINLHFIAEVRRQLSGTEEEGTSTFNTSESTLWHHYIDYQNDIIKYGEILLAVETLDAWLIDELTGASHDALNRDYSSTHKWRKTEEYVHDKGILWI